MVGLFGFNVLEELIQVLFNLNLFLVLYCLLKALRYIPLLLFLFNISSEICCKSGVVNSCLRSVLLLFAF